MEAFMRTLVPTLRQVQAKADSAKVAADQALRVARQAQGASGGGALSGADRLRARLGRGPARAIGKARRIGNALGFGLPALTVAGAPYAIAAAGETVSNVAENVREWEKRGLSRNEMAKRTAAGFASATFGGGVESLAAPVIRGISGVSGTGRAAANSVVADMIRNVQLTFSTEQELQERREAYAVTIDAAIKPVHEQLMTERGLLKAYTPTSIRIRSPQGIRKYREETWRINEEDWFRRGDIKVRQAIRGAKEAFNGLGVRDVNGD
jgi:hypothetical protein